MWAQPWLTQSWFCVIQMKIWISTCILQCLEQFAIVMKITASTCSRPWHQSAAMANDKGHRLWMVEDSDISYWQFVQRQAAATAFLCALFNSSWPRYYPYPPLYKLYTYPDQPIHFVSPITTEILSEMSSRRTDTDKIDKRLGPTLGFKIDHY